MNPEPQDLTVLLNRGIAGDRNAADQAFTFVYDRLRAIAAGPGGAAKPDGTMHATALVHEVFAKLVKSNAATMNDRRHFFSVAAKAMRHIAIDHARKSLSKKRGGGAARVSDTNLEAPTGSDPLQVLALDEALKELTDLHERQASVVELRYFAGLSVQEVADTLGCSPRTVELDWRTARAWLRTRLGETDR